MRVDVRDFTRDNRIDGNITYYCEPVMDSDINLVELSHMCSLTDGLEAKQGNGVMIDPTTEKYVLAQPLNRPELTNIVCRGTEFMDSQKRISVYEGDVLMETTVIDPDVKNSLKPGDELCFVNGVLTTVATITKAGLIAIYGNTGPNGEDLAGLVDDAAAQALVQKTFVVIKTKYMPIMNKRTPVNLRVEATNYRTVIKRNMMK
jgi:hypothetical protein